MREVAGADGGTAIVEVANVQLSGYCMKLVFKGELL